MGIPELVAQLREALDGGHKALKGLAVDDLVLGWVDLEGDGDLLVHEVLEKFDFDAQIGRLDRAKLLYLVISKMTEIDLHPDAVSNTEMGYLYEELVRRFSEASNETAGEHFTPREVIRLMVDLLFIEDDDALRTWRDRLDLEVGLDIGIADARLRRTRQTVETDLRRSLRRLAPDKRDHRTAIVLIDDIDLVADPGDALLQLRASALELYAADVSFAFVVAASPGLFGTVHGPMSRSFASSSPSRWGRSMHHDSALDAPTDTILVRVPIAPRPW